MQKDGELHDLKTLDSSEMQQRLAVREALTIGKGRDSLRRKSVMPN